MFLMPVIRLKPMINFPLSACREDDHGAHLVNPMQGNLMCLNKQLFFLLQVHPVGHTGLK